MQLKYRRPSTVTTNRNSSPVAEHVAQRQRRVSFVSRQHAHQLPLDRRAPIAVDRRTPQACCRLIPDDPPGAI